MSYLPHERSVSKAGSIGIPIPGGSFSLESDCGEIIDTPGISGQLIYRGPNVSMGYADGVRDLTRSDLWQGILRTGDVAKVDSEGYYFIVGRLKRFIKIFGRRVNLSDVENFIHGIGYNVACSGRDDTLEIYMVTSNKSDPLTLKKKVADYLQINYLGVVVYGISSLPINESGKIQYSNLKPILGDLLA
jgi:acyl-CoA synthetase (AMP-forming)/AMP-acid ligase II